MKILSIGNFTTGWDGSICDEEHIAQALEGLGHTVERVRRDAPFWYDGSFDFDFVLLSQWDGYDIERVKKLPHPLVYWAFDYQADGQEWHEKLIQASDLYLSKRIADNKYPNWQWLSQDFAPQFLDRYSYKLEKSYDVLFTGSYLPWATERNETLKLVDDSFNLHIFSVNPAEWTARGFKHVQGPVMDHGLPELIAKSKINLSIDHTIERGYWSDRNAQAICCGGFVLFRYVPLSESVFRSNIAYYFGQDDALSSVNYWLEHDEDREYIAAEAYDNAPYYRVKERVADMLNIVRSIL